jgi:hypothetical protein
MSAISNVSVLIASAFFLAFFCFVGVEQQQEKKHHGMSSCIMLADLIGEQKSVQHACVAVGEGGISTAREFPVQRYTSSMRKVLSHCSSTRGLQWSQAVGIITCDTYVTILGLGSSSSSSSSLCTTFVFFAFPCREKAACLHSISSVHVRGWRHLAVQTLRHTYGQHRKPSLDAP